MKNRYAAEPMLPDEEDMPPPKAKQRPLPAPEGDDGPGDMPGNEIARPKSAKSVNAIVEHLNATETTVRDSAYWPDSYKKPFNPDDLVQRHMDYSVYDKDMLNDDQVSVCLELKKDLVLGSGFEFVCEDEDDPMGEEIKCDLERAFNEDPDIDIEHSLSEILTAYEIGFSLTEKVWKEREDGAGMTIKFLKTRHPATWLIHTDEQGNISRFEQRARAQSLTIDPSCLIHYVNNPRYQNPYGRSDLRAAYDAWFIKREIIKFYAIYLEKAASPTPVARYDKNAPPSAVTDIYNAVKKFQTKTALVLPKEIEVDFLESKSNGEAYIKGINIFNMFIGRALFIPDLIGFQGAETGGGSHQLGESQMRVFFQHITKRRTTLEKIINSQLVRPFVRFNYGLVDKPPKFRLKEISEDKIEMYARLWIEAIKGKFWKPSDEEINYFRKLIKFPRGLVEREIPAPVSPTLPDGTPNPAYDPAVEAEKDAQRAAQAAKLGAGGSADPSKDSGSSETAPGASGGEKPPAPAASEDKKPPAVPPAPEKKPEPPAAPPPEKKKPFAARKLGPTPGAYSKKVDFKLMKSALTGALGKIMNEADPLVKEVFDDLKKQIRDKKILASQDLEKVDKIKLKKTAALQQLLKRRFKEMYSDAGKQAASEIKKGLTKNFAAPLPDEDFLAFLDTETFQYIGDWEYTIKKKVRVALQKAIKDGESLADVFGVLDDEGMALSFESMERFARTKLTEVMNRARKETFEKTGVVAAYQFTAIIDDRVSDICAGLHGAIFEKEDAPVPPLHFNCRSTLIPITKYEDYEVTKNVDGTNIDKFIDENIGDGFSRQ